MKRYNRRNFTLVELMFVVAILVILIGISWVAGTKVLRSQAKSKTKAEITMLVAAVKQYKDRFGAYPPNDTSENPYPLSFGQYLSKVKPDGSWTGKRPMFIDFKKHNINVGNDDYDATSASTTKVYDPYENTYLYYYNSTDDTFAIWSVGLDGDDDSFDDYSGSGDSSYGDDVRSDNLNE